MTQAKSRAQEWAYIFAKSPCLRPSLQSDPDDSLLRNAVFDSHGANEIIGSFKETLGTAAEQEVAEEAHVGTINVNSPFIRAKPNNA